MSGGIRDDRESWLCALEVGLDMEVDTDAVDPRELAEDKAAFLARLDAASSTSPSEESRRRPLRTGLRDLRRVLARAPLLLLVLLVAVSALLSDSAAVALALFVVAPVAFTVKWGFEAYHRGLELARDGELLGERAHEYRVLRRRVDALGDAVDGVGAVGPLPDGAADAPSAPARTDLRDGVDAVSHLMRSITDRLRLGSRGARRFAAIWRSEPDEACDRLVPELVLLDPDLLATELQVLTDRLTALLPKVSALALPGGATEGAAGIADEIDEIRRVVAHSRVRIVDECRRLYWAFDWLHSGAARKIVTRRLPGAVTPASVVGVAGLAGLLGTNLSTRDPVARTRRRVRFLDSVEVPSNRTLAGIRRATVAAVRDDAAAGTRVAS